jgi:hypothetical protein
LQWDRRFGVVWCSWGEDEMGEGMERFIKKREISTNRIPNHKNICSVHSLPEVRDNARLVLFSRTRKCCVSVLVLGRNGHL